jgi:flagellar L-ring protein FlgH
MKKTAISVKRLALSMKLRRITETRKNEKPETAKGKMAGSLVLCIAAVLLLSFAAGCTSGLKDAREIKSGPMPKKYYATREPDPVTPDGSLWQDRASLYEDRKARRVNDLLTIIISETTNATKKAATNNTRSSEADYHVGNLFGANVNQPFPNIPLLKNFYAGGRTMSPTVTSGGAVTSTFAGSGDTSRTGTLTATITAKVIEVLPNSSLIIESRKEVIVNNEKEIVVLKGIVRPEDISTNNTISSAYIADAQIYLVGDGVLADKQSQGWLVRFLDKVWPF